MNEFRIAVEARVVGFRAAQAAMERVRRRLARLLAAGTISGFLLTRATRRGGRVRSVFAVSGVVSAASLEAVEVALRAEFGAAARCS